MTERKDDTGQTEPTESASVIKDTLPEEIIVKINLDPVTHVNLDQKEGLFVIDGVEVVKELKVKIIKVEFYYQRWAGGKLRCSSLDMIEGRDKETLASIKCGYCRYLGPLGICLPRVGVIAMWDDKKLYIRGSPTSAYSLRRYLELLAKEHKKFNEVITMVTCKERRSQASGDKYWRMNFREVKSSK